MFILALKVDYSDEEVYVIYNSSLERVIKEVKKIRGARSRYEKAALYRASIEDGYISAGKLICKFRLIPKYYSQSKDEYYF